MIRINLIASPRDRVKKQSGRFFAVNTTVLCSLLLVATGAGIGWWFWSLRSTMAKLEAEIIGAQQETVRLKTIIQQVRTYEQRRTQLKQRVALIERLKKGQSGPVHLLDHISRSLPDMMWLTEMIQEDAEIVIKGQGSTLTALSDFVGNLEASGQFKQPVEIVNSQVKSRKEGDLIEFSIKAQFAGGP